MNVLIIYATTEGHTGKVVDFISELLTEQGHSVSAFDTEGGNERPKIDDFDAVIIAGSVHSGKHQEALELFIFANRDELNKLPTLFLSVSMAAAFEDSRADAERYVREFSKSTNLKPSDQLMVAGAIRPGDHDYYQEATLEYGDLAAHAQTDMKEDKVFTDWDALRDHVIRFVDE